MSGFDWSAPFEQLPLGATFTSRARTVTETDLVSFAALTGDWHPQHTDTDWAASSNFGQRVAHGMLVLSYAVGLVPFDPERVVALRRISDAVFKRPVTIGASIHVAGRIQALTSIGERAGLVRWRWKILDRKDALLSRADIEILWSTDTPKRDGYDFPLPPELLVDIPRGVLPC